MITSEFIYAYVVFVSVQTISIPVVVDDEDILVNNTVTATYKSNVILPCPFEKPIWFKNLTQLFLEVRTEGFVM